jgi:hypothetical protein
VGVEAVARLPRLPRAAIVDPRTGNPTTAFTVYWQRFVETLEQIPAIQEGLAGLDTALATVGAAVATVQAAAEIVQAAVDASSAASQLTNSYVTGLTLSATDAGLDASITISSHTRKYPQADGSTVDVAVTGATLTGLSYTTDYWIYYDQPSRAGGAVTYHASTAPTAQTGDRHNVGAVTTPAASDPDTVGNGVKPPGYTGPG